MASTQPDDKATATPHAAAPLLEKLSDYFASGLHSDLAITCGSQTHRVHHVVICSQCPFFEKAMSFKEGTNNTVDLPDDKPEIVAAMIEYLYRFSYAPPTENSCEELLFHIDVYAIAAKYLIPGLQDLARKHFTPLAKDLWHTSTWPEAIRAVNETTVESCRDLRDLTLDVCMRNIATLSAKPEFMVIAEEGRGFARDLMDRLCRRLLG